MAKAARPEPTPFEKFEDAARRIFSVPKKRSIRPNFGSARSERPGRPTAASSDRTARGSVLVVSVEPLSKGFLRVSLAWLARLVAGVLDMDIEASAVLRVRARSDNRIVDETSYRGAIPGSRHEGNDGRRVTADDPSRVPLGVQHPRIERRRWVSQPVRYLFCHGLHTASVPWGFHGRSAHLPPEGTGTHLVREPAEPYPSAAVASGGRA